MKAGFLKNSNSIVARPLAEDVRRYDASPYMALQIRRPVFQSATELKNHIIWCTVGENFCNQHPWADLVIYRPLTDNHHPVMGDRSVGQVLCFFRVLFPSLSLSLSSSHLATPMESSAPGPSSGRFAAIRPMEQLPMTPSQQQRAMPRFQWSQKGIIVVRIGSIEWAACVVPILPSLHDIPEVPSKLLSQATSFILNTKVDLETFATFY